MQKDGLEESVSGSDRSKIPFYFKMILAIIAIITVMVVWLLFVSYMEMQHEYDYNPVCSIICEQTACSYYEVGNWKVKDHSCHEFYCIEGMCEERVFRQDK